MSSIRYLTPRDIANMTPVMVDRRAASWRGIIRGLEIEHYRRYHGHDNAHDLLEAVAPQRRGKDTCIVANCGRDSYSRGMCEKDYRATLRAEKKVAA